MTSSLREYGPPLMTLLPAALQSRLWAAATVERYKAGQIIHYRGDDRPGLSIVKTGYVDVGTLGRDGRFLSIGTLSEGDSFGEFSLFAGLPRTHDISAVVPCEIAQISAATFLPICDAEPLLLKAMLKVALIRSHSAFERIDDNRRLPLAVRTAKHLTSHYTVENNTAEIKLTQDELAQIMGVSRVSIGKALSRLVDGAFIRLGYGCIYIEDVAKIKTWVMTRQQTDVLKPQSQK